MLGFDRLVRGFPSVWVPTFLWVYLVFCAGIWAKRYDAGYVAGAARLSKRHPLLVVLGVWVAGLAVGATAAVSLMSGAVPGLEGETTPMAVGVPLVVGVTLLYPAVFAWTLHRGRARPLRPRPGVAAALRIASDATIFLLTLYLLTFVYASLADLQSTGGPPSLLMGALVLLATAILLWLFYLPGRIHTLFAEPESRANWIGLWLTCAAAAVFAVAGVTL